MPKFLFSSLRIIKKLQMNKYRKTFFRLNNNLTNITSKCHLFRQFELPPFSMVPKRKKNYSPFSQYVHFSTKKYRTEFLSLRLDTRKLLRSRRKLRIKHEKSFLRPKKFRLNKRFDKRIHQNHFDLEIFFHRFTRTFKFFSNNCWKYGHFTKRC